MANILTGIRIVCGILLFACPAFSGGFYLLYLAGGVTDALDGAAARRLGQESDFGAKFDTAADIVFALSAAAKMISSLYIPLWLMIWTGAIAAVRLGNIIAGYIKYHEMRTVHSTLNRICGAVVFTVPLFIGRSFPWQAKAVIVIAVCILATAAAAAESVKMFKAPRNRQFDAESDGGYER